MRYNSIKYLADPDPTIVLPAGTLKVWFEVSDAVLFVNTSPPFDIFWPARLFETKLFALALPAWEASHNGTFIIPLREEAPWFTLITFAFARIADQLKAPRTKTPLTEIEPVSLTCALTTAYLSDGTVYDAAVALATILTGISAVLIDVAIFSPLYAI